MKEVRGRVSVVTGAASGMGRSLATQLAGMGSHVACSDIDEEGLLETARMARKVNPDVKVTCHLCNVADKDQVYLLAEQVLSEHGKVNLLFANAGMTVSAPLIYPDDATAAQIAKWESDWARCFQVDFFGVLDCVRAFMPSMKQQKKEGAHIVLTSSLNGMWTWPEHSAYTAAKFGVRALGASLLAETYVKAPHIKVSCVHPGAVNTGIVRNSFKEEIAAGNKNVLEVHDKFSEAPGLTSSEAAAWILEGVRQDQTTIMVGSDAVWMDRMVRVSPHRSYDFWKGLAAEGVTEFDFTKVSLEEQIRKISALGWLRVLFLNGGWYFVLWNIPGTIAGRWREFWRKPEAKL